MSNDDDSKVQSVKHQTERKRLGNKYTDWSLFTAKTLLPAHWVVDQIQWMQKYWPP